MQAKKVLVPIHGDESDDEALWFARTMTHETKGTVHVLYVIEAQRSLPLDADIGPENVKGEQALQRMEKLGKHYHCNIETAILQARDAGPAIVQEAVGQEIDAIVMAIPYRKRHGVFSLGNTVPYILKNAPCPVLLLRGEIEGNSTAPQPARHK